MVSWEDFYFLPYVERSFSTWSFPMGINFLNHFHFHIYVAFLQCDFTEIHCRSLVSESEENLYKNIRKKSWVERTTSWTPVSRITVGRVQKRLTERPGSKRVKIYGNCHVNALNKELHFDLKNSNKHMAEIISRVINWQNQQSISVDQTELAKNTPAESYHRRII